MAKIVVGLSGGVDSAVAAMLLQKEGHELVGLTLRSWESGGSRCCEIDAARETADFLGFPYHVINCVSDFKKKIEAPFIESYMKGLTPNPCILCNPEIKWEWMLYASNVYQADKVATGHYANLIKQDKGYFSIQEARDLTKDQSYMLYRLTQKQLKKTIFPLGRLTKQEVRQMAADAGLPSARAADSQEVCFVTKGGYADYIECHMQQDQSIPGEGNFIDSRGQILGRHKGIIHYTVGQRKGLGIALGYPVYVKSICPETNEVVLARENELMKMNILCGDNVFFGFLELYEGQSIPARVKVRYHDQGRDAWIERCKDNIVRVHFESPVRAPAPGQSAVYYDKKRSIIGGGIIIG